MPAAVNDTLRKLQRQLAAFSAAQRVIGGLLVVGLLLGAYALFHWVSAPTYTPLFSNLAGEDARPAFLGNIYGPLGQTTVPADAPPLFIALAADDPLFPNTGFGLIESWRAAKRPVEFHYYEQGGHGFGMYPKTTTSTGWFDAFVRWLGMHGMLSPAS